MIPRLRLEAIEKAFGATRAEFVALAPAYRGYVYDRAAAEHEEALANAHGEFALHSITIVKSGIGFPSFKKGKHTRPVCGKPCQIICISRATACG